MNKAEAAKIAHVHSLNAVNRIEFRNSSGFDDPYKRLAAAVILQAAVDHLTGEDLRSYWYMGEQVRFGSRMSEEDYRFYADIAGINYSWEELLYGVKKRLKKIRHKKRIDAAELLND